MTSVGEQLRAERLRQGLSLTRLASDTRINIKYLEAIETDTPQNLPGGFFYRSFVRQYALALGLDSAELESELDRIRESETPRLEAALAQSAFPIKQPDPIVAESNRRYLGTGRMWASVLTLVAVLVGCSTFYGWWHRIETRLRPAALQGMGQEAVSPAQTPAGEPAPPRTTSAASAQPVMASDSSAPDAQVELPTNAHVIINISATEKTWVAMSSDGKPIFSGTLQPSETKTLGGKERFWIRVGNAGGLEITWNGKPIGPIGPKGQVRTIVFTPDNYEILQNSM
jgi:cytoskeleton protein RodZ